MNEIVRWTGHLVIPARKKQPVSQSEVERAFREVFRWIGEDPDRDGLRETPNRLARAFQSTLPAIGRIGGDTSEDLRRD